CPFDGPQATQNRRGGCRANPATFASLCAGRQFAAHGLDSRSSDSRRSGNRPSSTGRCRQGDDGQGSNPGPVETPSAGSSRSFEVRLDKKVVGLAGGFDRRSRGGGGT